MRSNRMMSTISKVLSIGIGAFLVTQVASVSAATPTPTRQPANNCQPIYGGGQTCKPADKLVVDKKIIHPTLERAVDNIGVNDPKFKPGQEIRFSIAVRNTGTTDLTDIELVDTMADYVTFTSGNVEFDEENNEFFYTIDRLKAGETKVFELKTKVIPNEQLPSDRGIICVANRAAAAVNDQLAEDTANFCMQKDILRVTPGPTTPATITTPTSPTTQRNLVQPTPGKGGIVMPPSSKGGQPVYPAPQANNVPKTGPEALALFALIPASGLGFFLRNKAK